MREVYPFDVTDLEDNQPRRLTWGALAKAQQATITELRSALKEACSIYINHVRGKATHDRIIQLSRLADKELA